MPSNKSYNTLICLKCNVQYPPHTNFCTLCGSNLEEIQSNPSKNKKGLLGEIGSFIETTAENIDKATSSGKHNTKTMTPGKLHEKKPDICPNCKATLRPNIKFCNHCGTKLIKPINNSPPKPTKKNHDDFHLLEKLADMHKREILSTEEFNEQKKRILDL